MDELLPRTMIDAIQINFVLCAILIMEVIINYWMLIPIMILAVLFVIMTKFYLKTAQSVKRLEGVSKYWEIKIISLKRIPKRAFRIEGDVEIF